MVFGILLAGVAVLESMLKKFNINFEKVTEVKTIVSCFPHLLNLEYTIPPVYIRLVFFNLRFPIIKYNEF